MMLAPWCLAISLLLAPSIRFEEYDPGKFFLQVNQGKIWGHPLKFMLLPTFSSQTQPLEEEVDLFPADATQEEIEAILTKYIKPMEDLSNQLKLDMTTVFLGLFACRGDIDGAKAFLMRKFDLLKRPPIPKHQLATTFARCRFD